MSDLIGIFNGLVTLAVGTTAFIIYGKQKRDAKRNAANIILLEIESAEQQLQIITSDQSRLIPENVFLMKNTSWDTYRYHFVRDFDRNEWDKISDFYNKCSQYDAAVANQGTYFDRNVDQTQMHLQRVLANYASKYAEDLIIADTPEKREDLRVAYESKKKDFINAYGLEDGDGFRPPYFYNPRKASIEAKAVIENIETNLSLTSVGSKLKRMTRRQGFWAQLRRQPPLV